MRQSIDEGFASDTESFLPNHVVAFELLRERQFRPVECQRPRAVLADNSVKYTAKSPKTTRLDHGIEWYVRCSVLEEMITRTQKRTAARVPTIQLYNDRLATAVDLQRQGQPARNLRSLNFMGLYQLFNEVNGDIEEYLDLFAERALPVSGRYSSTRQVVTTWSHFLRATQMAQSRVLMAMVPVPRSLRLN